MYTGQSRRLGCGTGTPAGLGILPALIAPAIQIGEQLFSQIFGGSPKAGNEKIIAGWAGMVASAPDQAALPPTPYQGAVATPAQAWLWLRCWAGDHSVDALYTQINPGDTSTATVGCIGSDVAPDARTLVAQLRARFPQLSTPATVAPLTPSVLNQSYTVPTLPGLPTTIGGVPTTYWLVGGGLAVLWIVSGRPRARGRA